MLFLIFRSAQGQTSSSVFCSRIGIYKRNLSLCKAGRSEAFISLFVSPSLPLTIARPQLQPGCSQRRRGALQMQQSPVACRLASPTKATSPGLLP